MLLDVAAVLLIGGVAVAIGIGFGIVVAPRLGRLFDRFNAATDADAEINEDEEPRDRAD
jgi:hypothetical protein